MNKGKWTHNEKEIFEREIKLHIQNKKNIKDIAKEIPTRNEAQIKRRIAKMKKKYIKKYSPIIEEKTKKLITKIYQNENEIFNENEDENGGEYFEYVDTIKNTKIKIEKNLLNNLKSISNNNSSVLLTQTLIKAILVKRYFKHLYLKKINEEIEKDKQRKNEINIVM